MIALEIWPYASDVWLEIRLADQPDSILDLRMEGCREIRYLRQGDREELYFVSYDGHSQYPVNIRDGWRLQVSPRLRRDSANRQQDDHMRDPAQSTSTDAESATKPDFDL